jgi:hypothetical protein
MRHIFTVLLVVAMFTGGLLWITNSPEGPEQYNPPPEEEAVKSIKSLIEHVQGFFQDFETSTYNLEKAFTYDGKGEEDGNKASFALTFLGIMKFLGILIGFGLAPAIGIASGRARRKQAVGNIMEIDF